MISVSFVIHRRCCQLHPSALPSSCGSHTDTSSAHRTFVAEEEDAICSRPSMRRPCSTEFEAEDDRARIWRGCAVRVAAAGATPSCSAAEAVVEASAASSATMRTIARIERRVVRCDGRCISDCEAADPRQRSNLARLPLGICRRGGRGRVESEWLVCGFESVCVLIQVEAREQQRGRRAEEWEHSAALGGAKQRAEQRVRLSEPQRRQRRARRVTRAPLHHHSSDATRRK